MIESYVPPEYLNGELISSTLPYVAFARMLVTSEALDTYLRSHAILGSQAELFNAAPDTLRSADTFLREKWAHRTRRDLIDAIQDYAPQNRNEKPAIGKIPFDHLVKSDPLGTLRSLFGEEILDEALRTRKIASKPLATHSSRELSDLRKRFQSDLQGKTLEEVAEILQRPLQSFFELNEFNQATAVSYQTIEGIRKGVFAEVRLRSEKALSEFSSNSVILTLRESTV